MYSRFFSTRSIISGVILDLSLYWLCRVHVFCLSNPGFGVSDRLLCRRWSIDVGGSRGDERCGLGIVHAQNAVLTLKALDYVLGVFTGYQIQSTFS